jgi:hypothetical protein
MFLPSKATGCARMQEDSLEHAALSLLRGVSQGDARRRACPRMPASTANVYPSRTRAPRTRQKQATQEANLQGFCRSPLTDSNRRPPLYEGGLRVK